MIQNLWCGYATQSCWTPQSKHLLLVSNAMPSTILHLWRIQRGSRLLQESWLKLQQLLQRHQTNYQQIVLLWLQMNFVQWWQLSSVISGATYLKTYYTRLLVKPLSYVYPHSTLSTLHSSLCTTRVRIRCLQKWGQRSFPAAECNHNKACTT